MISADGAALVGAWPGPDRTGVARTAYIDSG
jgi:hypothetical protein